MFFFLFTWDTYFGKIDYPEEYAYSSKPIYINEPGDYYVYDCFFSKTVSSIKFEGLHGKTNLLIEGCSFDKCVSTHSGGAISFYSNAQSSILIDKVCAYKCYIHNNKYAYIGNFAFVSLDTSPKNVLNLTQTSIVRCYESFEACFYSFVGMHGRQKVNSLNSTMHVSFSSPCLNLLLATSSLIKYSTFGHSTTSSDGIICFEKGDYNIEQCNVINNTLQSPAALLCAKGNVEARKCTFANNVAKIAISVVSGKQVILSECYVQEGKRIGNVVDKKAKKDMFALNIVRFETQLCQTSLPNIN